MVSTKKSSLAIGETWKYGELCLCHPLPTITRYTGKVLILQGDRDILVNISGSQKAAEAYEAAGADVRFQIIPGGKHIFHITKNFQDNKRRIKR